MNFLGENLINSNNVRSSQASFFIGKFTLEGKTHFVKIQREKVFKQN